MTQKTYNLMIVAGLLLIGFVLMACSRTVTEPGNPKGEGMAESLAMDEDKPAQAAKEVSTGRSGMRVEDPVTGEMEAVHTYDSQEFSTSSEDLVEEPLPGGGAKIDLKGRFRSTLEIQKK